MKIYIAGPITGVLNYRDTFAKKEDELIKAGHIVVNPAYLPSGLKDYMPICKEMINQCDAVYFLKGWKNSVGSVEEYEHATNKTKVKRFYEVAEEE